MTLEMVGQTFGRLRVTHRIGTDERGEALWGCTCACGQVRTVQGSRLRSGVVRSCGCLRREVSAERARARTQHGAAANGAQTPEYGAWAQARTRCNNPNDQHFKWYGARGIKVCERWDSFANFLADMGPRPSPKHSLGRIDNDGPYTPENCRWETATEQNRNTRFNHRVTVRGETHTVAGWVERTGVARRTLYRHAATEGMETAISMALDGLIGR